MEKIDEQIKLLKYEERVVNLQCNYIIYENKETDSEVTIQWGEDDEYCLIFAQSITLHKDWFGQPQHMPIGLTCREFELFNSKIQEMKKFKK